MARPTTHSTGAWARFLDTIRSSSVYFDVLECSPTGLSRLRLTPSSFRWQALARRNGRRRGEVAVVDGDQGPEPRAVLHLADGTPVALRPMQPDDAGRLRGAVYRLSPEAADWRVCRPLH